MKKLITFLMFLLAVGQGATAQEVSGQQMPLPNEELHQLTPSTELHQLAPNAELHQVTPTYSDILMMKALSSSELLATPNMPIVPMPFAIAQPLVYGYDAYHHSCVQNLEQGDYRTTFGRPYETSY